MDETAGVGGAPTRRGRVLSSLVLVGLVILLLLAAQGVYRALRGPSGLASAQVGAIAPDFALPGPDGAEITLSSFRGRPVLLNFRTTWCSYCREEAPVLQEAHETIDGLVVFSVYIQESVARISAYSEDLGLTFPYASDGPGEVAEVYGVSGIPQSCFIDAAGVITAQHVGPLTIGAIRGYLGLGD